MRRYENMLEWYNIAFADDHDLSIKELPGGHSFIAACGMDLHLAQAISESKRVWENNLGFFERLSFSFGGATNEEYKAYLTELNGLRYHICNIMYDYEKQKMEKSPIHWTKLVKSLTDAWNRITGLTDELHPQYGLSYIVEFNACYNNAILRNNPQIGHDPNKTLQHVIAILTGE